MFWWFSSVTKLYIVFVMNASFYPPSFTKIKYIIVKKIKFQVLSLLRILIFCVNVASNNSHVVFLSSVKSIGAINTGWPTKMSLFFFGNNFYKNEETFKIFFSTVTESLQNSFGGNHSRINNVLLYFFSN